ncbi:hypothetical protein LJC21_03130, partial [Bacteroides sp. OttesenSCG-928-E20]|nr:hypothetical protein [Bacteroides sp. OttesenSCG-928-E20]
MNATKYRKLFLLAVMVIVAQVGVWGQTAVGSLPKEHTYDVVGTHTVTIPPGVSKIKIDAWGGG